MKLIDNGFVKANQENEKTYLEILRSGVVIVPVNADGEILFVEKLRKGDAEVSLELPKGFLLKNETASCGAVRQLTEYTNLKSEHETGLGYINPLTGFLASDFKVFLLKIKPYPKVTIKKKSNIKSYRFVNPKDVSLLVMSGELKCSVSISAFFKAQSLKMFEKLK